MLTPTPCYQKPAFWVGLAMMLTGALAPFLALLA